MASFFFQWVRPKAKFGVLSPEVFVFPVTPSAQTFFALARSLVFLVLQQDYVHNIVFSMYSMSLLVCSLDVLVVDIALLVITRPCAPPAGHKVCC